MDAKAFEYRMAMTIDRSIESVQKLYDMGFNFLICGWWGHSPGRELNQFPGMKDWVPVLLKKHPEIAGRRAQFADIIQGHIDHASALIEKGNSLGMKTAFFLYAPAMPIEVRELHPELATGAGDLQCSVWPISRTEKRTCFCAMQPQIAEYFKDTIEELVQSLPPIDAIICTNGESQYKIGKNHCSFCQDIPMPEQMKRIRDQAREGAARVNPSIEIITRMWQKEHPHTVYSFNRHMTTSFANPRPYHVAMATIPAEHDYDPLVEVPKFQDMIAQEPEPPLVMRKLSWADFMPNQPFSPHVGSAKGKIREIMEISLEHCFQRLYRFIPCCVAKYIRRYIAEAKERGVNGLCAYHMEMAVDSGLNQVNYDYIIKCALEPDTEPMPYLEGWLKERYGVHIPGLAKELYNTQDIWTDITEYHGVGLICNLDIANRPACYDLATVKEQSYIWRGCFPDGAERMSLERDNLESGMQSWRDASARAQASADRVRKMAEPLHDKHRKELTHFFDTMAILVKAAELRLKRSFLMWALGEGKIESTRKAMAAIERWNVELERLTATDAYLQELTKVWSSPDGWGCADQLDELRGSF